MNSDPPAKKMSFAEMVDLARRHEDQIHCSNCIRDLSRRGYADWRICLQAQEVLQLYPSQDPDPNPLINGPYYFCDSGCLRNWVENEGPW